METVKKIKIVNDLGLHARAAAKIVELTGQYQSALFLKKKEREVDASNILSILTLSCPRGAEIHARAIGEDAEALIEALEKLFKKKFGEKK
ncbi:MAG: HPr family phosphocarrier protein [Deltaproteobacteria bacterium]|nr:HPr family phosphocarrier protein [Deltaproteobacteria bacterium]